MNSPEQADSSAEHADNSGLYEQLMSERDSVGSTRTYLRVLGIYYQSVPEHAANMMQLQRLAGLLTNPTNEPTFSKELTDAFYWGEILAYNTQERLVGEGWAAGSYKILSEAMVAKLGEFRDAKLPYNDNLLQVAATIMGGLGVASGKIMPPAMDQLIIKWAEEITDDKEQQWHIILGFRHVIIEVIRHALDNDDDEDGENSEQEVRERARISNEFLELADRNDIDDVQGFETEPINDIRERIMESYADYVLAYGPYDENNEDDLGRLEGYLTQAMNRDFSDMEGIEPGDFLRIGGNAFFILYGETDASQMLYMLGANEFLEGSAEALAIVETPSSRTIIRLQEHIIEADEADEETNPLGVVLVLKDPVLVNSEGTHIQIDGNRVAGLVMSNPDMHMSKYLL